MVAYAEHITWALYYEFIKHSQGIFLLSGFTYPKIGNQDKQSHEAGHQFVTLTQAFSCAFT